MEERTDTDAPDELLIHTAWLVRFAGELVPRADREDLVHDVLLSAMRREDRPEHPRGWLATVARNLASRQRRRDRNRRAREIASSRAEGDVPAAVEVVASFEVHRAVVDAVMSLDEPYRTAVLLRFWEDLPPREVARRTGVPVETARTRIKRGVDRARSRLDRTLGGRAAWALPLVQFGISHPAPIGSGVPVSVGAQVAVSSGGILMKKALIAVAVLTVLLAVVGISRFGWGEPPVDQAGPASHPSAVARVTEPSADVNPPSADRRATAAATAALDGDVRVVVSYHDGVPAPGVGIRACGDAESGDGSIRRTDASGIADFGGLSAGIHRFSLDRGAQIPVNVVPGQRSVRSVRLPRGVSVRGRVIAMTGDPIADATVEARSDTEATRPPAIARTDVDGRFELRDVGDGDRLSARAEGWQPSGGRAGTPSVRGRPGEVVDVELVLGARGCALEGIVLDDRGRPASLAEIVIAVDEDRRKQIDGGQRQDLEPVRIDRETFAIRADFSGRFSTDEVPRGHVVLMARGRGPQSGLVGVGDVLVAPAAQNRAVVHLAPGGSVFGVVRDESGQPYAGLTLKATFERSEVTGGIERGIGREIIDRECETAADGSYRIDGLFAGEVRLAAAPPANDARGERLDVRAGQSLRVDLVVAREWDLQVVVRDDSGRPLEGWVVMLSETGSISMRTADQCRTGPDGRRRVTGLKDARYVLSVHAPVDGERDPVRRSPSFLTTVERGEREVDVTVPSSDGTIFGRLLDPNGRPVADALVTRTMTGFAETIRTRSGPDGRFECRNLVAGDYRLNVQARGYPELSIDAALESGEVRNLGDVPFASPAELVVEVVAADGGTLNGVRVRLLSRDDDEASTSGWTMVRRGDARGGRWWLEPLGEGDYLLQVSGDDFAPRVERVRVEAGTRQQARVSCERGVVQCFEIELVPGPGSRSGSSASAMLHLIDGNGNEVTRRYESGPIEDPRHPVIRTCVRLLPGSYALAAEGHVGARVAGVPPGRTATMVRVPRADGGPIRVSLR